MFLKGSFDVCTRDLVLNLSCTGGARVRHGL